MRSKFTFDKVYSGLSTSWRLVMSLTYAGLALAGQWLPDFWSVSRAAKSRAAPSSQLPRAPASRRLAAARKSHTEVTNQPSQWCFHIPKSQILSVSKLA